MLKNELEHLCSLEQVPDDHFTFTAVPPKIVGMGTRSVKAELMSILYNSWAHITNTLWLK